MKKLLVLVSAVILFMLGVSSSYAASPETDFVFNASNQTITKYIGSGGAVDIPSSIKGMPVYALADNAFYGNALINSVIVPEGVEEIGAHCFTLCANLRSLSLPSTLSSQDETAITSCPNLLVIKTYSEESITGPGRYASCPKLNKIILPPDLQSFDVREFPSAAPINTYQISESNEYFSTYKGALYDKKRETLLCAPPEISVLNLPRSVKKIDSLAFYNNYLLGSVYVEPQNVAFSATSSGLYNYSKSMLYRVATGTSSYSFPRSVTRVAPCAFNGCYYAELRIPYRVSYIGIYAFSEAHIDKYYFGGTVPGNNWGKYREGRLSRNISYVYYSSYFPGWTTNQNVRAGNNQQLIFSDDDMLKYCVISLDRCDGSPVSFLYQDKGAAFDSQESYTATSTPYFVEREGYSFAGWYYDKAYTIPWNYRTEKMYDDTTFYAKWMYGINFESNGGTAFSPYLSMGAVTSLPKPKLDGYAFCGWYKDPKFTQPWVLGVDKLTRTITLYAKWQSTDTYLELKEYKSVDWFSFPEKGINYLDCQDHKRGKTVKIIPLINPKAKVYFRYKGQRHYENITNKTKKMVVRYCQRRICYLKVVAEHGNSKVYKVLVEHF